MDASIKPQQTIKKTKFIGREINIYFLFFSKVSSKLSASSGVLTRKSRGVGGGFSSGVGTATTITSFFPNRFTGTVSDKIKFSSKFPKLVSALTINCNVATFHLTVRQQNR